MKNIIEIEVGRIFPHPNNPRRDLGDLTELSESIKENGIMQNLTVVPKEKDEYTVVIGHRRLAAASLAGLESVPCVISEMDEKKQLSTMLLENMQRSDLTVLEQAEGFQMMMDLGETAGSISKATGFSETTVRHRLKLLELDREKLVNSAKRGATISDYIELEKIKDIKRRNKVLADVGTANFNYSLKNAIEEEKWAEKKEKIFEVLSTFAKETKISSGLDYVTNYNKWGNGEVEIPKDADITQYFWLASGSYIYLYKKTSEKEDEAVNKFKEEQERKNQKREEKKAELKAATETAQLLRRKFVFTFSNSEKFQKEIMEFSLKALLWGTDLYSDIITEIYEHYNIDDEIEPISAATDIILEKQVKPLNALLVSSYIILEDGGDAGYFDYYGKYKENEVLDVIYEFLVSLGYEMSDAERELQSGTSELFVKE